MVDNLRLHAIRRRNYADSVVSTWDEDQRSVNNEFIPSSPSWLQSGSGVLPDFNSSILHTPNRVGGDAGFSPPDRPLTVSHFGKGLQQKQDNAPFARADIGSNIFLTHEEGEEEGPTEPIARPDMNIRENRRLFLRTNQIVQKLTLGHIVRDKGSLISQPKYMYYLDAYKNLMLAAQRPRNGASISISYDEREFDKSSPHVVARLRSNFLGTEFILYDMETSLGKPCDTPTADAKRSPKAAGTTEEDESQPDSKSELCVILFEPNRFGKNAPRRMTVLAPALDRNGIRTPFLVQSPEDSMIHRYRRGDRTGMVVLESKEPRWNDVIKAYTLEFHGRVTVASVKNFQLVAADSPRVIIQFGRIENNKFNLDFQSPLCGIQAFAIAVASLDSKLACE